MQRQKRNNIVENQQGTVLVLLALILPVLALIGIGSLDISNGVRYKKGMQYSLDAALLDVAIESSQPSGSQDDEQRENALEERFKNVFLANFNGAFAGTRTFSHSDFNYAVELNLDSNTIDAKVTFDMETAALGLINQPIMTIGTEGSATIGMSIENYVIDIVMCIDATGSMQNTLDSVKAGARKFNADLRSELGLEEDSENIKIRVRPIFYRDWTDPESTRLIANPDFIDLDPSEKMGVSRESQNRTLEAFIASQRASGGGDYPEGAGACLNESIRSNWFDPESEEAENFFGGSRTPKVVPVIVFWTDAPISSLYTSRQYMSPTTPTNWGTFKQLWRDEDKINQERKIVIQFGPGGQGWGQISSWDRFRDGGSLLVGNNDAVKIIAEEIKEGTPDIARLAS